MWNSTYKLGHVALLYLRITIKKERELTIRKNLRFSKFSKLENFNDPFLWLDIRIGRS